MIYKKKSVSPYQTVRVDLIRESLSKHQTMKEGINDEPIIKQTRFFHVFHIDFQR